MSQSIWVPGLTVLAIGVAFAVALIWRLRTSRQAVAADTGDAEATADQALRVRDLELRRDDLYERLRRLDRGAEEADREGLEIAAARTLWELDKATEQLPAAAREKSPVTFGSQTDTAAARATDTVGAPHGTGEATVRAVGPAATGPLTRHPLLAGFSLGAGMVAVLGLLLYWAFQDATPKPQGGMGGMGGGAAAPARETGGESSPSARLDELKARLEADPSDIMAKKEIALILLQAGQWVEAFEVAGMIIQDNPEDPDGMYVQGVVRLRMGQSVEARNLFERVLANYPEHIPALLYRGLAFYQAGNTEQAVDTWEYALDEAGDLRPQFESVLAMVERGEDPLAAIGFDTPPAHPLGDGTPPAAAGESPAAPVAAAETPAAPAIEQPSSAAADRPLPSGDPAGFTVRVEMAVGVQPVAGATLFVYLRTAATGPPIAAKRIPAAAFPIDLFLGQADSMMGSALPESGNIVVRLDTDGNVMSRDAADLEASRPASLGDVVRITLGD